MTTENRPVNLLGLDRSGLEAFFQDLGEKPFRASQVLKWAHHFGVTDFEAMTNISKALRARLAEVAEIRPLTVALEQKSRDGSYKWLMALEDGNCVETVSIPEGDRITLCISSQVGCSLNCSFCSTATQGFNRNLSASEIVGQVWLANRRLEEEGQGRGAITNVVLMGMGEPLLNFDPVVTAIRILSDDHAYGLGRRRITLSTSGVVPAIDRLSEAVDVNLAVSLHAPEDELRTELVPLNRKYPIRELLAACHRYAQRNRHAVTYEYVMLDGVNDSPAHARKLARILGAVPAKVNLIPFNPFPRTAYRRSTPEAIERFRKILAESGLVTTTRKTRGDDIDAACGQLTGKVADRTQRSVRWLRTTGGATP